MTNEQYTRATGVTSEAITKGQVGSRYKTAMWLTISLRDMGLTKEEANEFITTYQKAVDQPDKPYTSREVQSVLKSVYKQQP